MSGLESAGSGWLLILCLGELAGCIDVLLFPCSGGLEQVSCSPMPSVPARETPSP